MRSDVAATLLCMSALFVSSPPAYAKPNQLDCHSSGHEIKVTNTITRGGTPDENRVRSLASRGYKTIVDFQTDSNAVESERILAESAGVKFVSIPFDQLHRPSETAIDTFISTVNDKSNLPIYVHCQNGSDQTGAMIAIYRMRSQHWSHKKATNEMLQCGFHPMFTALSECVDDQAPKPRDILRSQVASKPNTAI